MPWYKAGTVSVAPNSNAVTGTGTSFIANSRVGDAFLGPDGRWYEVTNIASNTAMSISPNYLGAAANAGTYALAPMQGYVKDSADALRTLVNQFGAKLAALGTTGNYDILPVAKGGTGSADLPNARVNLGLGSVAVENIVPVAKGGTGVQTFAAIQSALNGVGGYSRANILGSVSQSGGAPTGAILERGSNANGEYIKYADGTMICWSNSRPLGNLAATLGAIFYTGSQTWTFPQQFVSAPAVAGHISSTVGYSWLGLGSGATSASNTTFSGFSATSTTSAPTFSAVAIGRWF